MAEGTDDWGEFEDVLVEQQVGVVVATLNRPDKLNALSGAMRVSLRRLIRELPEREDAKVLVITGAGSAYFSGQTRSDKLGSQTYGALIRTTACAVSRRRSADATNRATRVCNSSRPGGAERRSALDDLFFAQLSHLFPGITQLKQHLFGVLSQLGRGRAHRSRRL